MSEFCFMYYILKMEKCTHLDVDITQQEKQTLMLK